MPVDGPVAILFDYVPWSLGQGKIPLAEWLAQMTFKPGVWGSKPTWTVCALQDLLCPINNKLLWILFLRTSGEAVCLMTITDTESKFQGACLKTFFFPISISISFQT